jgi:hypothetical protein
MVATLTFPPNKKVGYEEENGANVCKWEGNRSETAATTEDIQRVSPLYAQLNPWVAFRVCLFFFFQLPDNKNGGRMDYLALVALGEMSSWYALDGTVCRGWGNYIGGRLSLLESASLCDGSSRWW